MTAHPMSHPQVSIVRMYWHVTALTGGRKFDHSTPVLRELHWLLFRQRIQFKVVMTVFRCRNGLAPPYLDHDCRQHRSAVDRNRNTGCATSENCSLNEKLCHLGCGRVEQSADRTTNCVVYSTDICAKIEIAPHPQLLIAHLTSV